MKIIKKQQKIAKSSKKQQKVAKSRKRPENAGKQKFNEKWPAKHMILDVYNMNIYILVLYAHYHSYMASQQWKDLAARRANASPARCTH